MAQTNCWGGQGQRWRSTNTNTFERSYQCEHMRKVWSRCYIQFPLYWGKC